MFDEKSSLHARAVFVYTVCLSHCPQRLNLSMSSRSTTPRVAALTDPWLCSPALCIESKNHEEPSRTEKGGPLCRLPPSSQSLILDCRGAVPLLAVLVDLAVAAKVALHFGEGPATVGELKLVDPDFRLLEEGHLDHVL